LLLSALFKTKSFSILALGAEACNG